MELSVLLVAERLDGSGVDDSLLALQRLGDGVLGRHRLAGTRVGAHQHRLVIADAHDGLALKYIGIM